MKKDAPQHGDRILVFKEQWLKLILAKKKKIEVRGRAFKGGKYWLGHKKQIPGSVVLGDAFRIQDEEEWASHRAEHCVQSEKMPYNKTWGSRILCACALSEKLPYEHPSGAVGLVRYRAPGAGA